VNRKNTTPNQFIRAFGQSPEERAGGTFGYCKNQAAERLARLRGFSLVVAWFVFACVFLVGSANNALGSCGDYLQHRFDFGAGFLGRLSTNHNPVQVPMGTCKDGKCGSQTPVGLPNGDKVQVEDRSSELNLSRVQLDFESSFHGLVVESSAMVRQIFLEVAVPPPRARRSSL
jgi:hypothetical protein